MPGAYYVDLQRSSKGNAISMTFLEKAIQESVDDIDQVVPSASDR